VGGAGLIACVGGAFFDPGQFFQSYLIGYLFWSGVALGCLGILMLQHLTGGGWGVVIRRLLESGTRTLPLVAIMFVPILFGMRSLYVWARPEVVAGDALLQHKQPYLNVDFFAVRSVIYFAIWMFLAWVLNRWSRRQDETGDPSLQDRFQRFSGIGLVVFVLTMTFASVDWVMSLEPHWFSTIYGALFIAGHVLAAFSLAIACVVMLSDTKPLSEVIKPEQFHDLGKLLFAFVLVWAYFAFSQYLIIWSGNLPEEIPWYLRRLQGGWQWVILAVVILHFVLPFLLLLSRNLKQDSRRLRRVALLVVAMRLVDVYWMTEPAFGESGFSPHWMDVAAPVGLGGIWVGAFLWNLKRRPLLPLRDPQMAELTGDGAR
jgi:hypothetical protein